MITLYVKILVHLESSGKEVNVILNVQNNERKLDELLQAENLGTMFDFDNTFRYFGTVASTVITDTVANIPFVIHFQR